MGRLRRNLFRSAYLSGANLLSQFLVVPLYLHCWGQIDYGYWLVLSTIPTVFVLSEGGLSNAVGNSVAMLVAQNEPAAARNHLCAVWKFQGAAWFVVFVMTVLAAIGLPLRQWVGLDHIEFAPFVAIVGLLCLTVLAGLQAPIYGAIFRAAGRYETYLLINAHLKLAELIGVAGTLLLGGHFLAVAGIILAGRLGLIVSLSTVARRVMPGLRLSLKLGTWADVRPLLLPGISYLAFPCANALMNQGVTLLVNRLCGPAALVALSVARQCARLFQYLTVMVQTAIEADLTVAYAKKARERVLRLQAVAYLLPLAAAVPFLLGITLCGPTLVRWWTHKELGVDWVLLAFCAGEAVVYGIGVMAGLINWATNRVTGLALINIILNMVGLGVAAVLLRSQGIYAVPASFALTGFIYLATAVQHGRRLVPHGIGDLLHALRVRTA